MREVYLSENNLSTLKIDNLVLLEELRVTNNKLESLDISKNILLKNLFINTNNIRSLNTKNNINLQIIECAANQITSLDLFKNEQLRSLKCSYNLLSALDIRNNLKIYPGKPRYKLGELIMHFSCIENPNLKTVCIADNASTLYWLKDETTQFSTTCEPAAVESSEGTTELVLYPNPASSIVNLPLANTSQHSMITIANSLGQEVLQLALAPQQTEIPIDALPTGIYTLTLRTTTGNLLGQSKLVKY